MARFLDVESAPTSLTPIYGYLTAPLLTLEKSLEPISSKIDQLDRFTKIAKTNCHYPSEHGLTKEESAAIFLYTIEFGDNSFYHVINRALRAEDRSTLKPWFPYLKLFDTAVQKLPTVRKNVWRGITGDISKNYKKGDMFTWWAISSCSTSVDVIENFLGPNSTLFLIEVVNAKDISKYTNFPNENEVLLCPGTQLQVVSNPLDKPPMQLVHLQEITDDHEGQLATSLESAFIGSTSIHTSNSQQPLHHINTDQYGNRYDTPIQIYQTFIYSAHKNTQSYIT